MKTLKTIICAICMLGTLFVSAQTKEAVTDLPYSNKIEISIKSLESLFLSPDMVSIELAPGFHIEGTIENKAEHGPAITSILIKLNNQTGGILSIVRYHDQYGKIYYSGQLLKLHEQEGMLLIAEDQHYYFIETQQRFLVSE
jgi:hypothetical protein